MKNMRMNHVRCAPVKGTLGSLKIPPLPVILHAFCRVEFCWGPSSSSNILFVLSGGFP